jgi:hypothetical protein
MKKILVEGQKLLQRLMSGISGDIIGDQKFLIESDASHRIGESHHRLPAMLNYQIWNKSLLIIEPGDWLHGDE